MGLISKTVMVRWNGANKNWYIDKGYVFTKMGDMFEVEVENLMVGSPILIKVKCDYENCKSPNLRPMQYKNYIKYVTNEGKYFCKSCLTSIRNKTRDYKTTKNTNISKLYKVSDYIKKTNSSNSFEKWCIENNLDILKLWDYELNKCDPSEVSYGTHKKFYFKCLKGIHESELKIINTITSINKINCNACNSFAQWGIDNLGENFLEKYWDYNKNILNPWEISYGSHKKVWIKCQNKNYHGSYDVVCSNFCLGDRCSYCHGQKTHKLDSLGVLYPQVLEIWSDNNYKSPYEYLPWSTKVVYWKCPDGKHEDYLRRISESNKYNFRCPECGYSKGEDKISQLLISNGFIKIGQEEYKKLNVLCSKNSAYYIPQKTFDNLIGLRNGLLSYDFYLPNYNLLIEYQGEQHEYFIKGIHQFEKNFQRQKFHDKRKQQYAQDHNIDLLEIWYWNFDNIEKILEDKLQLNKEVNNKCQAIS